MCKSYCYGGCVFEAVRDHEARQLENDLQTQITQSQVDIGARMGFFELRDVVVREDVRLNLVALITEPVTDDAVWEKLQRLQKNKRN